MKRYILAIALAVQTLAVSVFGQEIYSPCIALTDPYAGKQFRFSQTIRNNATGEIRLRVVYTDGTIRDQFPSSPQSGRLTTVVAPAPTFYQLNPATYWQWSFLMPAAGRCVGAFASTDDTSDITKLIIAASSAYLGVKPPTSKGDIQILVIPEDQWLPFQRGSSYRAFYNSGRVYGGKFEVDLPPGWYRLVINNNYSLLTAKSVAFTFGGEFPQMRRP